MDCYNKLQTELRRSCPDLTLLQEEPMSRHTSFQIGGPVRLMALPGSQEELADVLRIAWETQVTPYLLGNGTNLLCADQPMDCFVIKTTKGLTQLERLDETTLFCGAGVSMAQLAAFALRHSLTGLEFAAGIPGSLGGGIVMNAGAYGGELKDVLVESHYLTPSGQKGVRRGAEQQLGYRTSAYADSSDIVTGGVVKLQPGEPAAIQAKMEELAEKRRSKQPLEYPSAGSTFKRPTGYFAAALIDQCGLRGLTVGGAQVSEKHAGFVINRGGATCADVLALTDQIREIVREKTGITLELEIKRMP